MDELKRLSLYCEKYTTAPDEVLIELERETHLKTLAPQMLTGHLQGQFLSLLSRLKQPEKILEIGTFTGYGAICLAQGLKDEGKLHTIEVNPELTYISQKYFAKSGLDQKIVHHMGDASELMPQMEDTFFDLVYLDAGKQEYKKMYETVIEKMKPGALLLVDNVLWSGKVVNRKMDKDTESLNHFNQMVHADPRVKNLLLPIRDGIIIIEKK